MQRESSYLPEMRGICIHLTVWLRPYFDSLLCRFNYYFSSVCARSVQNVKVKGHVATCAPCCWPICFFRLLEIWESRTRRQTDRQTDGIV